jgi:hypothetical protein
LRLLGSDGRLDPSHASLAALAVVSVDTVKRALIRLRELGLLSWQRRLVRDGWQSHQTSNAYVLIPEAAHDVQIARAVKQVERKKAAHEAELAPSECRLTTMTALAEIAARRLRVLGLA